MQKRKTQNVKNTIQKTHSFVQNARNGVISVEASNACKMQIVRIKRSFMPEKEDLVYIKQCVFCQRLHVFYNIGIFKKSETVCKCSALISKNTQVQFSS